MLLIAKYIVWFLIYSFIGWIYESCYRSFNQKRWVNSGFLNGPFIPIYGFGAVFDIFFLGELTNPLELFILAVIINCTLEYFTSFAMEKLFHARWWDYSQMKFNINGRICLLGAFVFGVFGSAIILYVHPVIMARTTDVMSDFAIYAIAIIGSSLMIADTIHTVVSLKDFEKKVTEFQEKLDIATIQAKLNYDEALNEYKLLFEEAQEDYKEIVDNLQLTAKQAAEKVRDSFLENEFNKNLQEFLEKLNPQESRLIRAFPTLSFNNAKKTINKIREFYKTQKELIDRFNKW